MPRPGGLPGRARAGPGGPRALKGTPLPIRKGLLLGAGILALGILAARPAPADPKGEAALADAFKALHAARSFSADMAVRVNPPGQPVIQLKGSVTAMKPNFLRVELKGGEMSLAFVSDGKNYFSLSGPSYQKSAAEAAPTAFQGVWEGEIDAFFGGEKALPKGTTTHAGSEKVDGVDCDLVKVEPQRGRPITYAIGRKDRLIRRASLTFPGPNNTSFTQANTFTNLRLNVEKQAKDFVFTPPQGARLFERPDYNAKLVSVGSPAPRFVAPSPTGGEVSLSDGIKGKKALVVNFWFYG